MRKYDSKIKEIQKRNSAAESNKEGRDMLIGMLFGGVFLFVAPVWFLAFLIATLTSSMEAWKVTGVCTLIFAVMVGLFSISNKLYKKDLKKNAQLNKETMKEILAEEEKDLKWDHAFNRYFSLQLGLPQNDDVKLTNKIMSIKTQNLLPRMNSLQRR